MIIDRHNYEEFFLLYVDRELSPADRAAVENFVLQNPDLAEELQMLKHVILHDETLVFDEKEILYQQAEGISLNNFEEYFLLSVDNELTSAQNEEVEKFVLKHPELQNEYLLLEQTRLEPEIIFHPDKQELLRKTEIGRRVLFADWMKISVAASMIGLVALSIFFVNRRPSSNGTFVKNTTRSINPSPEKTKGTVKLQAELDVASTPYKKTPVRVVDTKHVAAKIGKPISSNKVFEVARVKSTPNPSVKTDKTLESIEGSLPKANPENGAIASVKTSNKNNLPPVHADIANIAVTGKPSGEDGHSIIKHAVYNEIDEEEDDQEKSFYIGSAEINKNKLKGLFKKAAAIFEKKADRNDDERTLNIAGFRIKNK